LGQFILLASLEFEVELTNSRSEPFIKANKLLRLGYELGRFVFHGPRAPIVENWYE
jgi:hypothetical protein